MSKYHDVDILGIRTSRQKGDEDHSKGTPTGYGWTYKEADADLARKEREAKEKR